jgi:hypothetical protein
MTEPKVEIDGDLLLCILQQFAQSLKYDMPVSNNLSKIADERLFPHMLFLKQEGLLNFTIQRANPIFKNDNGEKIDCNSVRIMLKGINYIEQNTENSYWINLLNKPDNFLKHVTMDIKYPSLQRQVAKKILDERREQRREEREIKSLIVGRWTLRVLILTPIIGLIITVYSCVYHTSKEINRHIQENFDKP